MMFDRANSNEMSEKIIRVLLIEDNPGDARLVKEALLELKPRLQVSLEHVSRLSDGLACLARLEVDAILLDLSLPDSNGPETFYRLQAQASQIPVILLTGLDDEELAQTLMRAGAQDYLLKGEVDGRILMRAIRYAIERKLSADSLRASEERYRTLVEQASDGIYTADAAGFFLDVNTSGCDLLGYSRAELLKMNMRELAVPGSPPRMRSMTSDLSAGQVAMLEYELQRKDGTQLQVEISAKRLQDGRRQGIVRDITERRQMDERLQNALQLLQFHVENSPLAWIEFDSQYHILQWSERASQIFGWSAEEVLGKGVDDFRWVYEEDSRLVDHHIESMLGVRRVSSTMTNRNYRKDGTVIVCEWFTSAKFDQAGGLISVQSLVLDITERQQAELARRESEVFGQAILNNSPIGISVRPPGAFSDCQ